MSLGTRFNNPNLKVFSLKLKTKDEPKPIFIVSQKDENGKFSEVSRETAVSGTLIGVEPRENPHQGKTIKSVSVYLKDKDELYMVSLPYTLLSRSVFNSLLGLESFDDVELSLYLSKPKGKENKQYAAASVWQGGKLANWAYKLDELPATPEITFKGQTMRDTENLDKFFADKLAELNKKIKAQAAVIPNREAESVASAEQASAPTDQDLDGDVPF